MTIRLSSKGGGGGGGVKLAVDLTFPSSINTAGYTSISGIVVSPSLSTILNLSGKFTIDLLALQALTAESATVKMTIDGVVVWNDTFTIGTTSLLVGSTSTINGIQSSASITCETSLLLEFSSATDTNISLAYSARASL